MVTKAMRDAFQEGFSKPNAPLSPGEQRLLRHAAGPRLVFVEDEIPATINIGEISHHPCSDDGDIVDAEIIE